MTVIPFPGTIAADVIEPLDRGDAERLDKRIRLLVGTITDSMDKLYELVEQAKSGDIHVALGFPSWTAYLADAFTVQVRLEREQRRELVGYLSGEGVPNTIIADMAGVDEKTVRNDRAAISEKSDIDEPVAVTRRDGKTYKPKHKPPKPTDLTRQEAEEVTGRIREWIDAQPDRDEAVRQVRDAKEVADAIFRTPDIEDDDRPPLQVLAERLGEHFAFTVRNREYITNNEEWSAEEVQYRAVVLDLLDGMRLLIAPQECEIPEWDESSWAGEKINDSPRLEEMNSLMWDALAGLSGTEGEMLRRIGQSIHEFIVDTNKFRGMARMMHSVIEFTSAYKAQQRAA